MVAEEPGSVILGGKGLPQSRFLDTAMQNVVDEEDVSDSHLP